MSWRTHMVIGGNAVWLTALTGQLENAAILLVAGAVAALLPDIDAHGSGAKIHHVAGGALGMTKGVFRHRGFFHSILAALIVFVISFIFLREFQPLLPAVIALGYFSHPLVDGLNFGGVQYLFPLKNKFNLLPRAMRSPVWGLTDKTLFLLGALSLGAFLLLMFAPQLSGSF